MVDESGHLRSRRSPWIAFSRNTPGWRARVTQRRYGRVSRSLCQNRHRRFWQDPSHIELELDRLCRRHLPMHRRRDLAARLGLLLGLAAVRSAGLNRRAADSGLAQHRTQPGSARTEGERQRGENRYQLSHAAAHIHVIANEEPPRFPSLSRHPKDRHRLQALPHRAQSLPMSRAAGGC